MQVTTVQQERANFGRDFSQVNPLAKGTNREDSTFLDKLMTLERKRQLSPEQPITVVNLNTYPLAINDPLFNGFDIQARKTGKDYYAYVIRFTRHLRNTEENAPVPFDPIELATEYMNQYGQSGGVFLVRGDLERSPELEFTKQFKADYAAADARMIDHCWALKNRADGEWHTPNRAGARNIHAPHRGAAQTLYERGLLEKLPEWCDKRLIADAPKCKCGAELSDAGKCVCGRVNDPAQAYRDGDIDERDISLEKLTRAEVEELGISAYVAETADEKPARLKAALPKPLALFERKQIAAREKELEAAARTTPARKAS